MAKGFVPDHRVSSVGEIDAAFLQNHSIRALIVDLDNTLALPDDMEPTGEAVLFAERMREAGIPVVVVSNNHRPRVEGFCKKLDLPFVCESGKPFGPGIRWAIEKTGVDKASVALVGDQILTDVLAASVNGIGCILTEPIVMEDAILFRIKRAFEALIDKKRRNMKCSRKI